MDVTVSSVKISDLPKLEEESLVLSVQLQTDEKGTGQKMNKKKKQELYHNLHNLSDENELEVTNPDGLLQFVATHTSQPKLNIKAVKPGKKSGVAAFFGCNPRHESVAQSEAPIDVFSLARENGGETQGGGRGHGVTKSVVTVNHRMAEKSGVNILPSEVVSIHHFLCLLLLILKYAHSVFCSDQPKSETSIFRLFLLLILLGRR